MGYYNDKIPELIDKMKTAVDQCLAIIEKEISDDLADDKLHNALKAKRAAAEDVKYYAKEIDLLENGESETVVDPEADQRNKRKRYITE